MAPSLSTGCGVPHKNRDAFPMPTKTEPGKFSSEERKAVLLQRVNTEGRVLANLMAEEFGVSEDSIRRDLRDLSEAGLVQRFHGGAAKLVSAPIEFHRRRGMDNIA